MGTFLLGVFILLAGIGVGVPASYHMVTRSAFILSRLKKFQGRGAREILLLVVEILRFSLMWVLVISVSVFLVFFFFPAFLPVYLSGLFIALACALIENPETREEMSPKKFMERLDRDLTPRPDRKNTNPYPSYSAHAMKNEQWQTNGASLKPFRHLRWRCASCGGVNLFTQEKVLLRGTRMRFMVRCYLCGDLSLVRVSGILNCKVLTEAKVPGFQDTSTAAALPGRFHGGRLEEGP